MTDTVIGHEAKLANGKAAEIIIEPQKVVITGIDVQFGDLIILLIKLAFAAIPAGIIVSVIWAVFGAMLGGLLAVKP